MVVFTIQKPEQSVHNMICRFCKTSFYFAVHWNSIQLTNLSVFSLPTVYHENYASFLLLQ